MASLRVATDMNSFRTCTLMTPPALRISSTLSALTSSSDSRYRRTLVSKKASAPLIGFQELKLEILGQAAAEPAEAGQEFGGGGGLLYFQNTFTGGMHCDVVA